MTTEEAYRVLGLTPPASAEEVKRAYRQKALQSHPDRFQDLGQKAFYERRFLEIREAYAHLRLTGVQELPEEEALVPEFFNYRAVRSFAPKETEEIGLAEKLGLQIPWRVDSLALWLIGLPAAAVGLIYFLKLLLDAMKGGI